MDATYFFNQLHSISKYINIASVSNFCFAESYLSVPPSQSGYGRIGAIEFTDEIDEYDERTRLATTWINDEGTWQNDAKTAF